MRLLFCGDIVGRSGRDVLCEQVPRLRREAGARLRHRQRRERRRRLRHHRKDLPATSTPPASTSITTGNHVWDQRETSASSIAIRACCGRSNYPTGTPGAAPTSITTAGGRKVLVVNMMGRLFMDPLDDPFAARRDASCRAQRLGGTVDAIVVDIHAEATSEKMAMGHICDGRVSLVVGTHSHVPTADTQILPKGTAYQTDAGMCGDYDSVIGMDKALPIAALHPQAADRPAVRQRMGRARSAPCSSRPTTRPASPAAAVRPVGGKLAPRCGRRRRRWRSHDRPRPAFHRRSN